MSDDELFAQLSEALRVAHLRLRKLEADHEVKSAAAQRLIAITNAAKHDLSTASERLAAWNAELDSRAQGSS
ncbi:MAG: hypothetical protein ABIM89_06660 [Mycobacteriales bacterium]